MEAPAHRCPLCSPSLAWATATSGPTDVLCKGNTRRHSGHKWGVGLLNVVNTAMSAVTFRLKAVDFALSVGVLVIVVTCLLS